MSSCNNCGITARYLCDEDPGWRLFTRLRICLSAIFLAFVVIQPDLADAEVKVASVYSAEGTVELRRQGSASWNSVAVGTELNVGDTVRSGDDGAVAFSFVDGTLVRLSRLSAITFKPVRPSGAPVVSQTTGKGYYFSRGARNEPEIETPLVNAAIYGTELVVDVSASSTTIDVLHGAIKARNKQGELALHPGERVTARQRQPLERSVLARSETSVQWMIRSPFPLDSHDLVPTHDPSCTQVCADEIARSLTRTSQGQTLLSSLSQSPASFLRSDYGKVLNAIALWRTGDSVAGKSALTSISSQAPQRVKALASLILGFEALRIGDLSSVAKYLATAEEISPGLANTKLLESYLAQARGDPEQALEIVRAAREAFPTIPTFYDREAELLLVLEQPRDADRLLQTRTTQFGATPMSETLRGFAAVQRKKFSEASDFFERASLRDSSQSLPYLGQALVKVRSREYDDAKQLLSKAVHADPAVAQYRSYLGKLFFENEDTPGALEEFKAAIALDPNDPSPYLYRSFAAVANNDPVGALQDVEQSISLNNARAVYRSSVQLDRDLAVRGAGLGRVFNELGFSDAGRVEAIRSLTDDYSNFSAHRLLADSYNSVIDAEASLSEKRIADLLSPLSFNLFNSLGEFSTLDDYNALFDKKETRNAVRLDWNSNNDQIGGEILATGRTDTSGYLLSYQPYYMSGSRHKAFFGENVFRAALQQELSEADRVVFDGTFRMRDSEGPSEDDYSENIHIGQARLGYNYTFSPSLKLLLQGEYGRDRERTSQFVQRSVGLDLPDDPELFTTDVLARESPRQVVERTSVAAQLIYNSRYIDSVFGAEGKYADSDRQEYSPVESFVDFPDAPVSGALTSSSSGSLRSGNLYEYLSFKIPRTAHLTLGAAATQVEQDLTEVPPFLSGESLHSAVTPKFGLVLTPTSWLTTRAAYFESLSTKPVLEDLSSLEPTLVGGISQRYNDPVGTRSRNAGVGLDFKAPNTAYFGAQYLHRNLRESFGWVDDIASYDGATIQSSEPSSSGFFDNFRETDTVRGYVSLITSSRSSLSGEALSYLYRDTDPDDGGSVRTDRFRLGYRYFLGKHLSLNAQGTYRNQTASEFEDPSGFWLFDAGVSYRFAEQRGRIFARVDNILDRSFTYDQSVGLETPILEGRSLVVGVAYNFW
jgi:tetratricopeptide (TPR) repeat protein